MPWPFAAILTIAAGMFAFHAIAGCLTGVARIPLQFLSFEEFERGRTEFWGVIALDSAISILAIGVVIFALVKGLAPA